MIEFFNEDCMVTMERMEPKSVDVILTSPFYNTNKKAGSDRTLQNVTEKTAKYGTVRYDQHVDNMTDDEYCAFTSDLFRHFDRVLKENGVVLYNISYGSENTEGMFRAVNEVVTKTSFTVADVIGWKKSSALPNSTNKNRLTRIFEFVFVFCRKTESETFHCNKRITSYRDTGQPAYENIFNIVEARNNDGTCPFNKATFSTELCEKLLMIYAPEGGCVYDPFMGSGTTAVACERMGLNCVGSEISANQVEFSKERLLEEFDYFEPNERNRYVRQDIGQMRLF